MIGQGDEGRAQARDQQADQDEPAPSQPVVQTPHKGLAKTTDERSESGCQRDGSPAPAQLLTHGDDKDPKAAASSACKHGHPEGRRHDQPAIVEARARCSVPHNCRSFTGNTCRPCTIVRVICTWRTWSTGKASGSRSRQMQSAIFPGASIPRVLSHPKICAEPTV